MSDRYAQTFARLAERGEGAFIPFAVIGDPDPQASLDIVHALVRGGADMLELGLPFSDPIADGPTIQAADVRALQAGTRLSDAWQIIAALRQAYSELPIGLLVYANLVETHGAEAFYRAAAAAGVDSVLIADVPSIEAEPYVAAALSCGVLPVLIATPTAGDEHLAQIAKLSRGYTYVVTRAGVTGADARAQLDHSRLLARLRELGAPPPVLGFGISTPDHVRAAMASGAAGAISGSAVVERIARRVPLAELEQFVAQMKQGTRPLGSADSPPA